MEKNGGFTPENIRDIRNRAGDTIISLLHQAGDTDVARRIMNIETIGDNPLEIYIGKLKGFFKGEGSMAIHEYAQAMRKTQNPNAHPMDMKPLLHYLCEQYIRTEYRYNLVELLEGLLSLEGVDPNMLDCRDTLETRGNPHFNGKHVFDVFDTEEKLVANRRVILALLDAGTDGRLSNVWDVTYRKDGSDWELREYPHENNTKSHMTRAMDAYQKQSQM
ncbi:TPA: hypothetical protein DCZ36_01750 [Candidatus Gracilibacteria bacterium]|nr:hypothetical protein [Candidatus Gracilibacteria bacterium]